MTRYLIDIARRALYTTIVCLVLSRGAFAGPMFLFDFEADLGLPTPLTDISNGISATFSSPGDPGAFFVLPTSTLFLTLTGNALFQASPGTTLDILFDQDIQYVRLVFGSITPGQLTLTAFDQSLTSVGQSSAASSILPGGTNPEGSLSFGGTAFRSVALNFASINPTFAIDNVTNNVPEPASILLFSLGAILLVGTRRLRSQP